jgi:hypothetical protein
MWAFKSLWGAKPALYTTKHLLKIKGQFGLNKSVRAHKEGAQILMSDCKMLCDLWLFFKKFKNGRLRGHCGE